jgi:predicted RND superfamily exporter protein
MQEADRPWYSFLFSWERKIKTLESPKNGQVGRTFISQDRRRGRYLLRMKEEIRSQPREEVVSEIEATIARHGFRTALSGGLYPLQGQLSKLVEGSVVRGLGGMVALFLVIILIVSRSIRVSLAMGLCLLLTPLVLFGAVGLVGMPLDIISAPAANVALPLGIDEMIHLSYAIRRKPGHSGNWQAWNSALSKLWGPILISMLVVVSGFALFLLSGFPPTRRLGILVCGGAALTDLVVLVVLPAIATWGGQRHPRSSGQ